MESRCIRESVEVIGDSNFKQYLILSLISQRQVIFKDIQSSSVNPGLTNYQQNLLKLIQKVANGCKLNINKTGTRLIFTPGKVDSN